jgi:hypothetical protein
MPRGFFSLFHFFLNQIPKKFRIFMVGDSRDSVVVLHFSQSFLWFPVKGNCPNLCLVTCRHQVSLDTFRVAPNLWYSRIPTQCRHYCRYSPNHRLRSRELPQIPYGTCEELPTKIIIRIVWAFVNEKKHHPKVSLNTPYSLVYRD